MVKSKISVAKFLEQQLAVCGRSQREIAQELGYANPNIITMFKTGGTKVPLNKVGQLAKAIGTDPKFLMRLVLAEYMPDLLEVFESIFGEDKLISDNEKQLVSFIREATNGVPIDIEVSENRQTLGDALKHLVVRDQAKLKASVERYLKAGPAQRSKVNA